MPRSEVTAASTPASMPFFSDMGLAPAATLRRPSWTMAQASTVAVVVPSPATSSVFLATSLTSSAPIRSKGSSSSMSLAMDTPSLVMVGAPHFLSRTTLRPLGPRVTRTASASLFMPLSRDRRASSSNVISLAIWCSSVSVCALQGVSTLQGRVLTANHVEARGATADRRQKGRIGCPDHRSPVMDLRPGPASMAPRPVLHRPLTWVFHRGGVRLGPVTALCGRGNAGRRTVAGMGPPPLT